MRKEDLVRGLLECEDRSLAGARIIGQHKDVGHKVRSLRVFLCQTLFGLRRTELLHGDSSTLADASMASDQAPARGPVFVQGWRDETRG